MTYSTRVLHPEKISTWDSFCYSPLLYRHCLYRHFCLVSLCSTLSTSMDASFSASLAVCLSFSLATSFFASLAASFSASLVVCFAFTASYSLHRSSSDVASLFNASCTYLWSWCCRVLWHQARRRLGFFRHNGFLHGLVGADLLDAVE